MKTMNHNVHMVQFLDAMRGLIRVQEAREEAGKRGGTYWRVRFQYHGKQVTVTKRHDGLLFANVRNRVGLVSRSITALKSAILRECTQEVV